MEDTLRASNKTQKSTVSQLTVAATDGFEHLADRVPGLIAVFNVVQYKYVYVNQAVSHMLGYEPDDLLGKGFEVVIELIHPEDVERIVNAKQEMFMNPDNAPKPETDGTYLASLEYRLRHKKGNWVWVKTDESIYSRTPDGAIENVLSISTDITERKNLEESLQRKSELLRTKSRQALKASDDRYRAFLRNSTEGIWRIELEEPIAVDLPVDTQIDLMYEHAYLAEANEAMAAMYGVPHGDVLMGARLGDLLIRSDPNNTAYLTAFVKADYKLSGVDSHEVDSSGNDKYFKNSLVGIVEDGHLVRAWGTQIDVTDQVKAAQLIDESETRLSLALQAAEMGTWEWNVETGDLQWSDKLKAMFGLKPNDEVTYERYINIIYPDDRAPMQAAIDTAMKNGESYAIDHRLIWEDGSVHWIQGRGKAYFKDGKPVRMLGISLSVDERKQYEAALRVAESKFKTLFNSTTVGIYMPDREGRVLEANDTYLKMIGYSRTEFEAGKVRWDTMTPPEYMEIDRVKHAELDATNFTAPWEKEYIRKDGSRIPIMIHAVNMAEPPYGCIAMALDLTERKQAERDLEETKVRYQTLFESRDMGVQVADLEGHVIEANDAFLKMIGYTREDVEKGRVRWDELTPPEYEEATKLKLKKLKEFGEITGWEKEYFRKDGSRVPVLLSSIVIPNTNGLRFSITLDISERKKAEMQVAESEARFKSMADSASSLIWVQDENRTCTYFNKAWLDFTGRSIDQELAIDFSKMGHPDDVERVTKLAKAGFKARKTYSVEYRLRRHDGKYRWILERAAPRFSPEGEFLGYIGSCIDIEDIKRATERSRKLEARTVLLRREREHLMALNNAKDEFISIASHQLRTPSTGVKQYIGMLLGGFGGKLTKQQMMMLNTAYESNERQLKIIDDLLKTAHIDAGKVHVTKAPTDILQLVERVIDEQHDKFVDRDQKLVFKHAVSGPLVIDIDERLVRMVVENLVDNASKYSPEGRKVELAVKATAKTVNLVIRDHGVGIAKTDQKKLFQKFSRIDNERSTLVGGTGLGLYWAKKIIDLHDGNISVKSTPETGSTFTISLPRA